jgi:hypothetical protein
MIGPTPGRQTRKQELDEARDVYLLGTPGRKKSGLIGALLGGLQGLASGNGLGGAVGGALAGGVTGLASPKTIREQQFNAQVRPKILEGFAYEDADRAMQRQAAGDAIDAQYKQAQTRALDRSNLPKGPSFGNAPGIGIFNEQTGVVTTPAPPREDKRKGVDGNYYDLNNPKEKAEFEALTAKLPRDGFGRFITRADERARSRMGRGASGGRDTKAMDKAVNEFNQTKRALEEATARGDSAQADSLRKKLQGMSTNIASRYGSQYETGGGDWPYIKSRGGSAAPASSPQRSQAKAKLIAVGFGDDEAEAELNRLGIK